MMFERVFEATMAISARLLLIAALVMLVCGFGYVAQVIGNVGMTGPSVQHQVGWFGAISMVVYQGLAPAAYLLIGSAVINHLDRWARERKVN
ncbi:MAG: hypothetical protein JWM65_469 [Sphingomonas bacterium]|nr:hypothetical protein [Sphingomonas bacterium]